MLFDLLDGPQAGEYVLRLPPPADAFPLFPTYELHRQVAAMRLVSERTRVPIPRIVWFEPSGAFFGAPCFVMERVAGRAAPDMPPYTLEGWLLETTIAQRAQMERGVVDGLAAIHDLDAEPGELEPFDLDAPGDTALQRHFAHQRAYYDWIRGDDRIDLIDRMLAALEAQLPADEAAGLTWGDARLGNVLFRESEPVAFLDWEAAARGPRELDLGWLLYFADYYQRIAVRAGRSGLPDLLRPSAVVDRYVTITGHTPQNMEWHLAYAALRQALTSIRVTLRAVHFGERPPPTDPNDLIIDRSHLEEILSG